MTRRAQSILAAIAAVLAVVLMLSGCASAPQRVARDTPPMPPGWTPRIVEQVDEGRAVAAPPATVTADLRWPPVPFVPGYEVFFTPALTQPFSKVAETGGQTNVTVTGLPWGQGYFNVQVMKRYGQP